MTHIVKLRLENFKRFRELSIPLDETRNVILGDNEAGKSSILTAIELVLSGSRSRVESIGIENLMNVDAVNEFLSLDIKSIDKLPKIHAEIHLNEEGNLDLCGVNHLGSGEVNGIRLVCEPDLEFGNLIHEVLSLDENNFPFEFYSIKFSTFAGQPYSGFRKLLRYVTIDSANINTDYAHSHYIKTMYEASVANSERVKLQNEYRQQKLNFRDENLKLINSGLDDFDFSIRSGSKFNLETDLTITQDSIPIENRGKGRQCFVKTEFALRKKEGGKDIDVILLEEPENHLSHTNMNELVNKIERSSGSQIIIATHSSLICSRLDLRKAILINSSSTVPLSLKALTPDTAKFFIKAPNNNILELVLSSKVILVEGDAEYILVESLYESVTGSKLANDGVHVISVGGTSFKRYMELARNLNVRIAVIRDNDGDFEENCVSNYEGYVTDDIKVFSDANDKRYTFEVCIYQDNQQICDDLFSGRQIKKSPLDYMLANKTESAFKLLDKKANIVKVPSYIEKAFEWIRQ
ncbi:AAA family ATPase [Parasalinivibrio latis]|uniref:ATP-dependent nuclease n=1 Tax=Parasalinivibrio latis TaxID=2952610 RepID=UPI0030E32AEB